MLIVYFISVFVHIICAIVWFGGLVSLVVMWLPALRNDPNKALLPETLLKVGLRFRYVAWYCFAGLAVTGTYNVLARGWSWNELAGVEFWRSAFGETLAVKLVAFAIILIVSAIHDFWIGPKTLKLWSIQQHSSELLGLRKRSVLLGRLNFLFGLVVLICAVMLVRGRPF